MTRRIEPHKSERPVLVYETIRHGTQWEDEARPVAEFVDYGYAANYLQAVAQRRRNQGYTVTIDCCSQNLYYAVSDTEAYCYSIRDCD